MSEKEDFIADVAKECVHDAISALTTERDTLKKKLERYRERMMNCICLGCREAEGFATQDTKPTEEQE